MEEGASYERGRILSARSRYASKCRVLRARAREDIRTRRRSPSKKCARGSSSSKASGESIRQMGSYVITSGKWNRETRAALGGRRPPFTWGCDANSRKKENLPWSLWGLLAGVSDSPNRSVHFPL